MRRLKRRRKRNERRMILSAIFICFFTMGIGYALLQTRLHFQVKGNKVKLGPISFQEDDWDTISQAVKSGDYPYKVGDVKEVQVGNLGTFTVRVANTTTPSACSTSGYSESACGFVVEFQDIASVYSMNKRTDTYPNGTNIGGYPASDMKRYLNGEFFDLLPTDLQKHIRETSVVSSHGNRDAAIFTSVEKIYLLSTKEVWGKEGTSDVITGDNAEEETHQLDYYRDNKVTTNQPIGAMKGNELGEPSYYWLRSSYANSNTNFYYVSDIGDSNTSLARNMLGVAPAFRIG